MRVTEITRKTAETKISLKLNIDGTGKSNINTGIGFLDHMLVLFSSHAKVDLDLHCDGDVHVDFHHSTEDIGICLGLAFQKLVEDKRGLHRYGSMILPMDEALILSAIDISGRSTLVYEVAIPSLKVGEFDTELVKEFWLALVRNFTISLHIRMLSGENSHHIIEGIFKSVARSLKEALSLDQNYLDEIPSTKGIL
jgi:imidazoleglycerol-phosphate dehydratase